MNISELIKILLDGRTLSYDEKSFLVAIPHVKHKVINGTTVRLSGEDIYRVDSYIVIELFTHCVYFDSGWCLTEYGKHLTIRK